MRIFSEERSVILWIKTACNSEVGVYHRNRLEIQKMISIQVTISMLTGQLACPQAHDVTKVRLMLEWKQVAGNQTNYQISIKDIMERAIPVKAVR